LPSMPKSMAARSGVGLSPGFVSPVQFDQWIDARDMLSPAS
jgi:hypothetical protein